MAQPQQQQQQQPDPVSQCIALVTEGAQIELASMELDRQFKIPDAIASYSQAVETLQRATAACPEDHLDRAALEQHCREVSERLAYLQNLPSDTVPDLPLEAHINSVELTMQPATIDQSAGSSSSGMGVLGAVAAIGGVVGMMLTRGPVGGLAFAAGAAYTATRSDKAGEAARSLGQAGMNGAVKAKSLNEQYQITDKAKAAGAATVAKAQDLGGNAVAKAQELDAQYQITEKAKTVSVATVTKAHDLSVATAAKTQYLGEQATVAGAKTVSKAQDLDAQYRIRENAKKTADTVGKGLSTGFAVVSGLLQARLAGSSHTEPSPPAQSSSDGGEAQQTMPGESSTESSMNESAAQLSSNGGAYPSI